VKDEGEKVFQELHMNHLVYCLVIPLLIGSKVGQAGVVNKNHSRDLSKRMQLAHFQGYIRPLLCNYQLTLDETSTTRILQ
jgi:hypothetical protein